VGDVRRFHQIGGHVALDFVNTLGGRPDDPDDEYLHHYGDLVTWTQRVGLLEPLAAEHLRTAASTDVATAQEVLTSSRHLRYSLDQLLRDRLTTPAGLSNDDGTAVHSAYLSAIRHATPDFSTTHLRWTWRDDTNLERPLWPITVAAVDLLSNSPLHLLSRCQHCRWLFLDTSRQHNRRWCSMNVCGAIMKMRRYRAAHRP